MGNENTLKLFLHSQKAMSTVVGDNKNMARPVRGNFMACITYKVRHELAPDMKNLNTHQIIVRILILTGKALFPQSICSQ